LATSAVANSTLAAGGGRVARVWVVEPRYLPPFDPGRVLTLVEGRSARVVARARVLDRLLDGAPSPLADLRAAASRALEPLPVRD
jgi:hypothetical protein